jgi:hypothetical protein
MEELIFMQAGEFGVDTMDPMVAIAAIILTVAAKKAAARYPLIESHIKRYLPAIAILFAVFTRALLEVAAGHPPQMGAEYASLLAHGVVDGVVAVAAHSQFRSVLKDWNRSVEPADD